MANTIGNIQPFQPGKGTWMSWMQRARLYMEANDIAADRRVAVLLTLLGEDVYETLSNLISPAEPGTRTLNQIDEALRAHFQPQPLEITERVIFYQRKQLPNETLAQFIEELGKLARTCNFAAQLDTQLRDRFVAGMSIEPIQKRLLTEQNLTLARAQEVAFGMELAMKETKVLLENSEAEHIKVKTEVNKIRKQPQHWNPDVRRGVKPMPTQRPDFSARSGGRKSEPE